MLQPVFTTLTFSGSAMFGLSLKRTHAKANGIESHDALKVDHAFHRDPTFSFFEVGHHPQRHPLC